MRKIVLTAVLSFFIFSCNTKQTTNANTIVANAITTAGGNKFNHFTIDFDFRKINYSATRDNGKFELRRTLKDSNNTLIDIVSNTGHKRLLNNNVIVVPDSMASRFSASVNSVHYFSVLPYGLNDPAVNKSYLGTATIKGKNYYKVQVTFNKDGGGEDFEDVFVYWFNTETYKTDYIAYSYNEDHGLGLRFREAYNERIIKGIRIVDYNNYKPNNESLPVKDLDKAFEQKQMKLLSKIELENVTIEL